MSQLTLQAATAQDDAATAQRKLANLEGVLRSTAEHAAGAEGASHQANETVIKLQQQLAELKDRYGGHPSPGSNSPQLAVAVKRLQLSIVPCITQLVGVVCATICYLA